MTGHTDARGGHAVEMDTGHDAGAGQGVVAGSGPAGSPRRPGRPGRWWTVFVGCLLLTFVLLAAYDLVSGGTGAASGRAAASRGSAAPRSAVTAPSSAAGTSSASGAGASSAASTAPAQASAAGPRPLPIAALAAFGPQGTADGDNPGIVYRINDGTSTRPWYSLWYTTPDFGNLQAGTGLLLDLGGPVTVSGVRLTLGSSPGAALQVRTGDAANPAGLSTVATATDAGGTVWVPVTHPAAARYVLIWFTELPPDGQGTYQASVYNVTVEGNTGT